MKELTMEQTEHPQKHHRGSSPSGGAEQIYHDWIKRNGPTDVSPEPSENHNEAKLTSEAEIESETRTDDMDLAQHSDGKDA